MGHQPLDVTGNDLLTSWQIPPFVACSRINEAFVVFHTPAVLRIIRSVRTPAKTGEKTKMISGRTLDTIFGGPYWERFLTETPTQDAIAEFFKEGLVAKYRETGKQRYLFVFTHPLQVRLNVGQIPCPVRYTSPHRKINLKAAQEKQRMH